MKRMPRRYDYSPDAAVDTLSAVEHATLIRVTAASKGGARDHVIFALALGTGLRLKELTALNVGDVANGKGARTRVRLRPETTKMDVGGEIVLNDRLRRKVAAFLDWKRKHGESLAPDAPLFVSRSKGARLSDRMVEQAFHNWQRRAGFDVIHRFHALRHTACTNLYRATHDVMIVKKFARHRSLASTQIYVHPTVEDLSGAVADLPC